MCIHTLAAVHFQQRRLQWCAATSSNMPAEDWMLFYALCFPDQTATVPLGECLTPEQRAHREHETVSATRSAATQAARGHTISSMLERRAVSDNNGPKPRLLHEKSAYLVQGRGRSIDGSGTRAGSCGELSLQVVCTAPHQQVNHK